MKPEQTIDQTVGILGGGQLARMLVEAALRLGLRPLVLAESSADPAARLCPDAVFGKMTDPVVLRRFFAQTAVVTFENEFVDCDLLAEASGGSVRFLPGLEAIARLQDKLRQKEILAELGIPSAPFLPYESGSVEAWVKEALGRFEGECVFKWAKFGYDGKGTLIGPVTVNQATEFCEQALSRGARAYAEKRIRFVRELSLVSCHGTSGEFAAYPLVVSEQEKGICKRVSGPATSLGTRSELEEAAVGYAEKLARGLSLVGTFAIEMFETGQGDLQVNELAPRVHNSGHFTMDCAETSQFENHWRAILGLPLGSTAADPGFAMLNLLGPEGRWGMEARPAFLLPRPSARAHLHWYGKAELRPGRKMGHLNGSCDSAAAGELEELIEELQDVERRWIDGIQKEAE